MIKRACQLLRFSDDGKRAIYIDSENKAEILEYLTRSDKHKKKFAYIASLILKGIRNTEVFDKENINERCKDVTAMKFFKGNSNDRIYCKEVKSKHGVYVIVTAILHEKKKTQKNFSLTPMKSTKITTTASEFEFLFDLSEEDQNEVDALVLAAQFLAIVQECLDHKGMTRKEFAAQLGTSASWLTQLFRGDKLPSFGMLSRMAQVLDVQFDIKTKNQPVPVAGTETEQIALMERLPIQQKNSPFTQIFRPNWSESNREKNYLPGYFPKSVTEIPLIA